jgi:transposase-like protein
VKELPVPCPHCATTPATEQPRRSACGYRTFRCCRCRRTFNERTGTVFNHLQYPTDLVLLVVLWRLNGVKSPSGTVPWLTLLRGRIRG